MLMHWVFLTICAIQQPLSLLLLSRDGDGLGRRKTRSLLTLPEVFSELVGEAVDGSLEGDPQLLVQHDVCWGVGFSAKTATCCRLQLEVLLYVLSNRWQRHCDKTIVTSTLWQVNCDNCCRLQLSSLGSVKQMAATLWVNYNNCSQLQLEVLLFVLSNRWQWLKQMAVTLWQVLLLIQHTRLEQSQHKRLHNNKNYNKEDSINHNMQNLKNNLSTQDLRKDNMQDLNNCSTQDLINLNQQDLKI